MSSEDDGHTIPMSAGLFVTVGTDHHPFDRLVNCVDRWLARNAPYGLRCFVQNGTSATPLHAESESFLSYPAMEAAFTDALAVVCHGGPGSIMMALGAGKKPIVAPRVSALGEHVDDHQLVFARRVAESGAVWLAETEERLHELLDRVVDQPQLFRVDERERQGTRAIDEIETLVERLLGGERPARV